MEFQVDIRPKGIESAVVIGPFDKALAKLESKGYKIISLPQNSLLRIQQGKDSYISRNPNWTREGVLYTPKEKPKIVRNSPFLYAAKKATQAYRKGKKFYPTQEQIEQALADSADFPEESIEIPTNRFDCEDLTVWSFGGEKEARAYGEFLREARIKQMSVYAVDKNYVDRQEKPFVRQMWFKDLDLWSDLDGDYPFLNNTVGLRGVKMVAEDTAQNSEAYSPEDIAQTLNAIGITRGLKTQILNTLRK